MKYKLKDFAPLIIIFTVILGITLFSYSKYDLDGISTMRIFMGSFFMIFGFFKLINLKNFAKAYAEYDIFAKRSRVYAHAYPFFEVILGLFYLYSYELLFTNIATLVLMIISSIGVLQKLLQREKIICACLGVVFNIPMTWVTLVEDILMAVMAGIMLIS